MYTYALVNEDSEVTQLMYAGRGFKDADGITHPRTWVNTATQAEKDAIGFKTITDGDKPLPFDPEKEYYTTAELVVGQVFAPRVITKHEYTQEQLNKNAEREVADLGTEQISRPLEDVVNLLIALGVITEQQFIDGAPFVYNKKNAKENIRNKIKPV